MRQVLIATFLAVGLAACGETPPAGEEEAREMPNLPAIRDLWNFGDPAASEEAFRALAAEAEAAGNDTYAAEAMTQVARSFSLRGEFEQANAILDQVDSGPYGRVPVVRVRSLLERGRSLNSGGKKAEALPLFEQAFEIAAENGEDFLAGDAAHMAAIAADLEGERRWLARFEDFVSQRPGTPAEYWFGPMHNNLGWSYFFDGQYAAALDEFRLSREAYAAQEDKRYQVLIADYSAGRALRALDRCEEALPLQERTFAAVEDEFDQQDEYVAEEIALCRAALGDEEGAVGPAGIAYEKFSQDGWFVENEPARLETLRALSGN